VKTKHCKSSLIQFNLKIYGVDAICPPVLSLLLDFRMISSSDEITIKSSHKTSLEELDGLSFKDVFATPKKESSSQDEATVFLEDLTPNGQKKPVMCVIIVL